MEILVQSENLRLGVGSYRSPEKNNNNINESLKILLDGENIRLGISLSKKSIFGGQNKKDLSRPEKCVPNSENETDISK